MEQNRDPSSRDQDLDPMRRENELKTGKRLAREDRTRDRLSRVGIDPDDPAVRDILLESRREFSFSGPFPPPDLLADYEQIHPGFCSEIMKSWSRQQAHRLELETLGTEKAERRMDRSQIFGLCVALCGLVVAGVVGIYGGSLAASVIALVSVGGPAAVTAISRILPPPKD